jgi:hypothetical protein
MVDEVPGMVKDMYFQYILFLSCSKSDLQYSMVTAKALACI